ERLAHLGHHLAPERGAGTVNSGRVDEHDLPGLASLLLGDVDDSENAVARGLGLRRNDGQLLAHQRIQQRALARIGPSENANESGVEGHEDSLQFSVLSSQFSVLSSQFSVLGFAMKLTVVIGSLVHSLRHWPVLPATPLPPPFFRSIRIMELVGRFCKCLSSKDLQA